MKKYLIWLCVFACSACTVSNSPEKGLEADFHLPLQKRSWATDTYADPANHRDFCVISTGYGGIKVILRKDEGRAELSQAVKSTRLMNPGTKLRIAVGNHIYRSTDEFIPSNITPALIADLKTGDTAYIEWQELRNRRTGIQRYTNQIPLEGFQQYYNECVKALK